MLYSVLAPLYRIYHRTVRTRVLLDDDLTMPPKSYRSGREIYALSETDAIALGALVIGRDFVALVAEGRDGDWATALLKGLGCQVVRGSSLRGGLRGLRGLLTALDESAGPAAIVVDGPLGPAGQAKPGSIFLSKYTGRPIRGVAAAASRAVVFRNSWSRIYVPLPFSTVVVACGDRITVPSYTTFQDMDDLAQQLSRRLAQLRSRARMELQRSIKGP
ncbi:MAG: DUF374 domain-containing protein [Thermoanaerobaculales bacterium]|nr:DUF374 domain-containing protein [Thermoanaerobaculales bacterium]